MSGALGYEDGRALAVLELHPWREFVAACRPVFGERAAMVNLLDACRVRAGVGGSASWPFSWLILR
jgi:hypothetical protein